MRQKISGLVRNERGQTGAKKGVDVVVSLVVGGLVASYLIPLAIDEIVAVDTSNWGSGATSLWEILPVVVVLAVFLFFVGYAVNISLDGEE